MKTRLSLFLVLFLSLFSLSNLHSDQTVMIFLGPPGAGKGVLSKKLSRDTGLPHISTGTLLRQELENNNSPLAIELAEYMREGQLVPDDMILRILTARIKKEDCNKGFILEGFPRTETQAKALATVLPKEHKLLVVNLKVPDDVIIERLLGRRICSKCSQRYHVEFFPPQKAGKCDKCKGKLITRNDDCEVAIRNRLEKFHDQFSKIASFYQEEDKWLEVDADGAVEKNYSALLDEVHAIDLDHVILKTSPPAPTR